MNQRYSFRDISEEHCLSQSPPCLSLSPQTVVVQVFNTVIFFPFFFCHANLPRVLTETSAHVGGGVQPQCSLVPEVPGWRLVSRHVTVRVNSVPVGNRRLTLAASCLSCFVKAANLPFVAVDCSDKQTEK